MTETLDQLLRELQNSRSLGLEKRVDILERLRQGLAQRASGSPKALDSIITALAPVLGSSQVIACQAALGCIQPLAEYAICGASIQTLKALLHFTLPQLLDRLGDGRMAVRELALSTLVAMWSQLHSLQTKKISLDETESPDMRRTSMAPSSIPRLASSLKSRIRKPAVPVSPGSQSWSAVGTFEREVQAQGFGHKTWRVREMTLEWLVACVEQFSDFPASRFIPNAFALLDDNQDAVRFGSKRALNTIYHTRPEFQEPIVSQAQAMAPHRPTVLAAITAPMGELAAMPASPYSGMRSSSRLGSSQIGRPRSRVSRADSRLGGFPTAASGSHPSVPPLPGSNEARTGLRSMSQQGFRSGSRIGYSSPMHPSRNGHYKLPSLSPSQSQSSSHIAGMSASAKGSSPPSPHAGSLMSRPTSSLNGHRPHQFGQRRQLTRQSSQVRIMPTFAPSQELPAEVKPFNVPSRQSLVAEFTRTIGCFAGRETEDNWVQRERAIELYRGIVWGNAAIELREALVGQLKEHIHSILNAVLSLRTSLASHSMSLCDDIAVRLGPHASILFDHIVDALFKQCMQTKKIGAQRASKSLTVAYQNFPLRLKSLEQLHLRISEKSTVLRLAVVTASIGVLRSHGPYIDPADRRSTEAFMYLANITKAGLMDAQPTVREPSRELFWELYMASEASATKLMSELPSNIAASVERDRLKYTRRQQAPSLRSSPHSQPPPSLPMSRTPSSTRDRLSGGRSSFTRESRTPSIMSVVANQTPQRSPAIGCVSVSSDDVDVGPNSTSILHPTLDSADEDEIVVDPSPTHKPRLRVKELRSPVKERMSLGLIDFSNMDIGSSLLDISAKPTRVVDNSTTPNQPKSSAEESPLQSTPAESQATTVMADSMEHSLVLPAKSQPAETPDKPADDTPKTPVLLSEDLSRVSLSPRMSTQASSFVFAEAAAISGQIATPHTQTARYWHGPLETTPISLHRQPVNESPLPAGTPQKLSKVELCLQRLADNRDVNEALFRSLARFAKEESSTVWMDEAHGGHAFLDRILDACLKWLQNPAEGRDVVFIKDSCFDVLRVLVRRKSQYFTLEAARRLLLEVLRNRFFESTILSGSAEDVFYDMAAHLDSGLCFELAEDFFKRTPLPSVPDMGMAKPGYTADLIVSEPTPLDMDPMGVFKMDNALASVFEFAAEVIRRLASSEFSTELDKVLPYAVVCFVHPRSQVRKAALDPIIAVHDRLVEVDDGEFEELLLHATPEQLDTSLNPLAKYINQLRRPELRKLVWTFYQSRRVSLE
ncbi:suppressor of tub2 mutation [Coemansia sp. RSA 1290]|nr:suppressor of tub2 mutation [Coemansia sp. RSA 1290]KAJ2652065.1 suppressor of tub2 mutation [Coemansia sp. RSA 1250]